MPRIVFAIAMLCLGAMAGCAPRQSAQTAEAHLHARYFHRTVRCPSCEKIEALSKRAIEEGFSPELAIGRVTWQSVNLDDPGNAHYADDYQLQSQSLVVSVIQTGKETQWRNLEKVWDLLEDDPAFIAYVQEEIRSLLSELPEKSEK